MGRMPRYKIDSFNEAGMRSAPFTSSRRRNSFSRWRNVSPIDVNLRRIKVSSLFIRVPRFFASILSLIDRSQLEGLTGEEIFNFYPLRLIIKNNINVTRRSYTLLTLIMSRNSNI